MTQAANLAALGTNASSTGILPIAGGGTAGTGGVTGFKNRLINGNMAISQRGAVNVTASGGSTYIAADRFSVFNYFGSGQINTAISTSIVPTGYSYSLGLTVGTAVPLNGSTGYLVNVAQTIEGFNIADAYNQTVTVSFWVRSSITGTYSVSFYNASNAGAVVGTRLYATSYTINSANTWEQKTVTVDLSAGTASGTWDRGNGAGLTVAFGLGAESNRKGNTFLNTWGTFTSVYEYQVASQVNWASTLGATFYITGVQLEVGTAATNFDVRSYGTELQLCRRYLPTFTNQSGGTFNVGNATCYAASFCFFSVPFDVPARVPPTSLTASFSSIVCYTGGTGYGGNSIFFDTGGSVNNCLVGVGSTSTNFPSTGSLNVRGNGVTILFNGCEL